MTNLTIELPEVGLKGFFKLIVRNADESIVRETDWMPNMVLNTGLNYIGGVNGSQNLLGCHVGSSNAAVSAGQTGMQAFVAGTVTFTDQGVISNTSYPNVYTSALGTWRFGIGVAAGNLAEVGVAIGTNSPPPTAGSAANAAQPCFSRALIVDGFGVPTTITVLPTEILDVIYDIRAYSPTADTAGNFTVVTDGTPVNYSYVMRPSTNGLTPRWFSSLVQGFKFVPSIGGGSVLNDWSAMTNGTIGTPLTSISGTDSQFTGVVAGTYVSGNYFNDATFTASVSAGNLAGGISAMKFNFGGCGYMMSVSPSIPKINTQQFVITMRAAWANLP